MINDWFASLSQEVSTCRHRTGSKDITSKRLHKNHTNGNQPQTGSKEIAFEKFQTSQTVETHSMNCDLPKLGAVGTHRNFLVSNKICNETVSETDKSILNQNSIKNDVVKYLETASIDKKCAISKSDIMETLESNLKLNGNKSIDFDDTRPRVCMVGLHCCGDLTPTMLKCFRELECIRSLCCVSCCYHRLKFDGKILCITVKFLNFRMTENCCNLPKIQTKKPNLRTICQKRCKWNCKQCRP